MKVNKWTLGLAAAGVVSLPTLGLTEEKLSPMMTALSATTISGYVDTSAHWDVGSGNANPPPFIYNEGKQDGFNLNKVKLRVDKPLDEAQWAAGYRVDLLFGPDANVFGSTSILGGDPSDFAVQQAYVALRAPIGNGLDFKMGVFDSIIGYESHDSVSNPNYTRSYGTTIEPHTHTGLLMTYQFSDVLGVAAGVANTIGPRINSRAWLGSDGNPDIGVDSGENEPDNEEAYKTYMGSVALTAPESLGFLEGSTLYAGIVNGFNNSFFGSGVGIKQTSWYAGATLNTPVTGLKIGAALDNLLARDTTLPGGGGGDFDAWAFALYASIQATEKLSFHARGEYLDLDSDLESPVGNNVSTSGKIFAATGTIQYDLWKNVLSRLEVRWDHWASAGHAFGGEFDGNDPGDPDLKNAVLVAANLIYKF